MTISTTVLFDSPRREIASLLNCKLEQSVSTQIVAGFATIDGMKAIENSLRINPKALHAFVIGAGTYRAFDAFEFGLFQGFFQEDQH